MKAWIDSGMRIAWFAVIAALAVGCGPMQLAGNWTIRIDNGPKYNPFIGTMGLSQNGTGLSGTFAADSSGASTTIQGGVAGSLTGDSVSMTWTDPRFTPALVTATAPDEHSMHGTVNGSDFVNAPFSANKL